jgi:hypothetical protein
MFYYNNYLLQIYNRMTVLNRAVQDLFLITIYEFISIRNHRACSTKNFPESNITDNSQKIFQNHTQEPRMLTIKDNKYSIGIDWPNVLPGASFVVFLIYVLWYVYYRYR